MLLGFIPESGDFVSMFSFSNGYSVEVKPHGLTCSSVRVLPTAVMVGAREMTENEKITYALSIYNIHHADDSEVTLFLANVATWPIELETKKKLDAMKSEASDMPKNVLSKHRPKRDGEGN